MKTNENETLNQPQTNQKLIDAYDYLTNAASAQDCTGLIPSAPASDAELESYEAIYKYQPPEIPSENKNSKEPPSK